MSLMAILTELDEKNEEILKRIEYFNIKIPEENKNDLNILKTIDESLKFLQQSSELNYDTNIDLQNWQNNLNAYSYSFLKGKVANKTTAIQEGVLWFVSLVANLTQGKSLYEAIISIVKQNLLAILLKKIVILKNNETRCMLLKITILSNNKNKKEINIEDIENFSEEPLCPFYECFKCAKRNRENPQLCSNKIPFNETLCDLRDLGVIVLDDTRDTCHIVGI